MFSEVLDEFKKVADEKAMVHYTNSYSVACGVCQVVCLAAPRRAFPLVDVTRPKALFACRGRCPSQAAVLRSLMSRVEGSRLQR
jgi:ferredoxin